MARYRRLVSRKEYRKVQDVELTWADKLLKQGEEKGIEKGLEQGREQGLEQGRKQGLEQGREAPVCSKASVRLYCSFSLRSLAHSQS